MDDRDREPIAASAPYLHLPESTGSALGAAHGLEPGGRRRERWLPGSAAYTRGPVAAEAVPDLRVSSRDQAPADVAGGSSRCPAQREGSPHVRDHRRSPTSHRSNAPQPRPRSSACSTPPRRAWPPSASSFDASRSPRQPLRSPAADQLLRGVPGVLALVRDRDLFAAVEHRARALADQMQAIDEELDRVDADAVAADGGAGLEALNAAMVELKDAVWAIERDRLRTARAVEEFAGRDAERRGHRGLHLGAAGAVRPRPARGPRARLGRPAPAGPRPRPRSRRPRRRPGRCASRTADSLFGSMAVRTPDGNLSFVYKASAEIGELGDNTRALRGRSPATRSCAGRSPPTPPRRWCSATPAGPASASSPRPTPTP